ncbi:hypothetical protein CBL_00329 [Carabus blaptoides fortunei]
MKKKSYKGIEKCRTNNEENLDSSKGDTATKNTKPKRVNNEGSTTSALRSLCYDALPVCLCVCAVPGYLVSRREGGRRGSSGAVIERQAKQTQAGRRARRERARQRDQGKMTRGNCAERHVRICRTQSIAQRDTRAAALA